MLEVFRDMLLKEGASFFVERYEVHCKGVRVVTAIYKKDDKFYHARSFYTDAWICAKLSDLFVSPKLRKCEKLSDIAEILCSEDLDDFAKYRLTMADLQRLLNKLESSTSNILNTQLSNNPYGDRATSKLSLAPVPSIVVTIKNDLQVVGSLLVLLDGTVRPTFVCQPRLGEYAYRISQMIEELRTNQGVQPLQLEG